MAETEHGLTPEELHAQDGEPLPERAALTSLNPAIGPMPPVVADDVLYPIDPIVKPS